MYFSKWIAIFLSLKGNEMQWLVVMIILSLWSKFPLRKKLHLWFSEADLFLKSQHFRNAGDEIEILISLNSFTIFKNLQFFYGMHTQRLGTWQQVSVYWRNSKRVSILLMVFVDSFWKLPWPLCFLNMRLKFLQWYVYVYSLLQQNTWQRLKGARVMWLMS